MFNCEVCQLSKHTHKSYPSILYESFHPFAIMRRCVRTLKVKNIMDKRWFVSFIDDHIRLIWIFLMKDIFEACQIFQISIGWLLIKIDLAQLSSVWLVLAQPSLGSISRPFSLSTTLGKSYADLAWVDSHGLLKSS